MTPGERAKILKIIENGPQVFYLIGKVDWTTKIVDLDPSQGLIIYQIRYFGEINPLNASGDPPVRKLNYWKSLSMVEKCPRQLEKIE